MIRTVWCCRLARNCKIQIHLLLRHWFPDQVRDTKRSKVMERGITKVKCISRATVDIRPIGRVMNFVTQQFPEILRIPSFPVYHHSAMNNQKTCSNKLKSRFITRILGFRI